ncbi:hypothetical protein JCM5296_004772 [Sporobolomyces johnsonii]
MIFPFTPPPSGASSSVAFGGVVTNLSLSSCLSSPALFQTLQAALYTHKVLLVKNQAALTPQEQFDLMRLFDPAANEGHGHNDATVTYRGQKSLLYGIGNALSGHPEVKLVGGGKQSERFGGANLQQADHTSYHRHPLTSEERAAGLTRFHRWHMDCSLFRTSLPLVTSLLCVASPANNGPELTVRWDDGTGYEMKVKAGATAFLSGSDMLEALNEEERRWVEEAEVEYAPWPYQWNGPSRGNSNGLGTYHEPGNTMLLEDLPEWEKKDVKRYPVVWTCPVTGEKSFQVHSVAVLKIHHPSLASPMTDLAEIRKTLYDLQRKCLKPENVWAPAYEKGDLVLFNNRAVYHSATDYPQGYGTRSMLQAHIAASFDPK